MPSPSFLLLSAVVVVGTPACASEGSQTSYCGFSWSQPRSSFRITSNSLFPAPAISHAFPTPFCCSPHSGALHLRCADMCRRNGRCVGRRIHLIQGWDCYESCRVWLLHAFNPRATPQHCAGDDYCSLQAACCVRIV
jgi:hypothetical protein